MDERIDILDSEGNPTAKIALKSEAHQKGLFHATVHIWMYTRNGMLLLQQRGKLKETYPLLWDVSVAGHIGAGESIESAAIREVQEEIGLTIEERQLEKIGIFKSIQKHHEHLVDCEFHHSFLCELTKPLERLEQQKSEIKALRLVSLTEFLQELFTVKKSDNYVPHSEAYYKKVVQEVKNRL